VSFSYLNINKPLKSEIYRRKKLVQFRPISSIRDVISKTCLFDAEILISVLCKEILVKLCKICLLLWKNAWPLSSHFVHLRRSKLSSSYFVQMRLTFKNAFIFEPKVQHSVFSLLKWVYKFIFMKKFQSNFVPFSLLYLMRLIFFNFMHILCNIFAFTTNIFKNNDDDSSNSYFRELAYTHTHTIIIHFYLSGYSDI
jgi:hypothetical protein